MRIDRSAYDSLELTKIFGIIGKDCRSDLGMSFLMSAAPASDAEELKTRHNLFKTVEEYRDAHGDLPWNKHLSSVEYLLDEAKMTGMLMGEELLRVRHLLQGSARLKNALLEAKKERPIFSILLRELRDFSGEEEALSVIDDNGRLYDHASDRLRRLRIEIRGLRDKIRGKGQSIIADPVMGSMLQERVLTNRNGRYVVLVRQDAISNFSGLVVDRSGSGSSVYMEPNALAALNNDYLARSNDEETEERRILHNLTAKVLVREADILDAERVLGRIDSSTRCRKRFAGTGGICLY